MNFTHTPGRGRHAKSPLDETQSAALGHRVRGPSVEVCGGRIRLRGRAHSYHVKHLDQHAVMAATDLPLAASEIQVVSGPRRRVVLASSDDRVRAAGRARLAASGWVVTTARDGLECVERLRQSEADVAVLDADLLWGGADGVLADIAAGTTPDVPVVLLGPPPETRAGGAAARVAAVLQKPVDLDALAWSVAGVAAGRAATGEWPC